MRNNLSETKTLQKHLFHFSASGFLSPSSITIFGYVRLFLQGIAAQKAPSILSSKVELAPHVGPLLNS